MAEGYRVLVVDDDPAVLETLCDVLELKGYSVTAAQSGFEAIDQAARAAFDVVLLDIVMPDMDGVETLKELRRNSPEAKVVMMTGYAVDDLIEEALREGATEVLRKPLSPEQLFSLVDVLCRQQPRGE